MSPTPLSIDDLLAQRSREFILLAGKDGSGKSSALVSLAKYIEVMHPDAMVYVLDTENKLRPVFQTYGAEVPRNIAYYQCTNMNDVTEAVEEIFSLLKDGDWVAVESMSRVWEKAQDLGYLAVTGMDKAAWMDRRQEKAKEVGKKNAPPVTPRPDDLWSITKGAHDGAFLERLSQHSGVNVLLTTTLAKPPKENNFRKESESRVAVRQEFGIDMGLEGAPRLPYYAQTLCLLERRQNQTYCRVVRDNLSVVEEGDHEFHVPSRKEWASAFFGTCRG